MKMKQPSLKELLAQRQALEEQVSAGRQQEADSVLVEIVRKMREYEISLAELIGRDCGSQKVTPAPVPKYRDSRSGATWNGRGQAPHWIVDKNRDEFLVRA